MTRIDPVRPGEGKPLARVALREARRRLGRVPESFAVTAHHQGILSGNAAFELALDRSHAVPTALKELASVKAASVVGCEFCLDIGSWLARTHGVTEAQLRELIGHRDSDAFTAEEKDVLDFAEAMTRTPVEVPEDLFARLRERFDERQLVELTGAIAWENYRARFNAAFDIGAQGFSEGAACAMPAAPVAA